MSPQRRTNSLVKFAAAWIAFIFVAVFAIPMMKTVGITPSIKTGVPVIYAVMLLGAALALTTLGAVLLHLAGRWKIAMSSQKASSYFWAGIETLAVIASTLFVVRVMISH